MTPKKIYIAQVYLDELIDSEDYHEQDVTVALSPYNEDVNQNAYILESEHNKVVKELKKHLQIMLAALDGQLDADRSEYGESYPESEHSINAKEYLKSIK